MDWYLLSKEEVIEKLGSSEKGLAKEQVQEKLEKFGENKIKKKKDLKTLKIFLGQFKSFLILILIIAAILSFFMVSKLDAFVIIAIVVLNAGIGFTQEYKADKAIEELKKVMVPFATVLRENKSIKISSEKLVPGDIIILNTGDRIAADARIIASSNLKINEAPLTGESFPEEKNPERLESVLPLGDRRNMVYQGTEVVFGSGKAIIVETGMRTEFGRISELVQEVKAEKNPFKEKLDSFAKKTGIFVLILAALIVILLILSGIEVFQSFLVAVSLAVSAIPEGLPAVVSLGLAFATKRMIAKNVLIRRLTASETLGRTTVICTDKTGTLTEEKMKVSTLYVNGKINPESGKELLLKIGILCNNARVEKDENGEKYFIGDPTEIALINAAENDFFDKKRLTEKEPKIKEFSFSSERKIMSVVRKPNKKYISYVKGAPEEIIKRCEFELIDGKKVSLGEKEREKLTETYEKMARDGLRVLGFAYKTVPGFSDLTEKITENNLIFAGFQGMIDPPRAEVKNAIKLCSEAGIKVLMITGDSRLTAEAIAKEIGLNGKSIDAGKLDKMTDRELYHQIKDISVFSRISPEDKLRIINILKQRNEIVAMTGDGINDALALKRSDIGISMGIRGTDVARNSSDIILTDDNFNSIVEGVKEGRRIYDNTKKSIKYLLSANFYEVFFIILVILIWRNPELLPLLPLQILWINLVTDSLPALALTLEEPEKDIMKKTPNKDGILNGITSFIFFAGIVGIIIILISFIIHIDDIDKARTMVVTTSIMYQMLLTFNCKTDKLVFKSFFSNKYLMYGVIVSIALHLIVLYTPLNTFFGFIHLGIYDWVKIIGLSSAGFFAIEGLKIFIGKRKK